MKSKKRKMETSRRSDLLTRRIRKNRSTKTTKKATSKTETINSLMTHRIMTRSFSPRIKIKLLMIR